MKFRISTNPCSGASFSLLQHASKRQLLLTLALVPIFTLLSLPPAHAQTFSVLYAFCSQTNCADGAIPNPNLLLDSQGNVYGTTATGGASPACGADENECGTLFKITSSGQESVILNFAGGPDGDNPNGGLVRDASGNFYGTSSAGGGLKDPACHDTGCGDIFEVSPAGKETALFTFPGTANSRALAYDGAHPQGNLIFDSQGNLYGTTYNGGPYGDKNYYGVVYELSANGDYEILHAFAAYDGDGKTPNPGLVMDSEGNLYGTTYEGGIKGCPHDCGTVFKITPDGTESILYAFKGKGYKREDGGHPDGSLIIGANGNFYGTTSTGGANNLGTIYELTPAGVETVLYSFTGGSDGDTPTGTLVQDANGNLYGTTQSGGVHPDGVVFEFSASGVETTLYNFTGLADGGLPEGGLVLDGAGNLYGSTYQGGNHNDLCSSVGCGVVFKLTP